MDRAGDLPLQPSVFHLSQDVAPIPPEEEGQRDKKKGVSVKFGGSLRPLLESRCPLAPGPHSWILAPQQGAPERRGRGPQPTQGAPTHPSSQFRLLSASSEPAPSQARPRRLPPRRRARAAPWRCKVAGPSRRKPGRCASTRLPPTGSCDLQRVLNQSPLRLHPRLVSQMQNRNHKEERDYRWG